MKNGVSDYCYIIKQPGEPAMIIKHSKTVDTIPLFSFYSILNQLRIRSFSILDNSFFKSSYNSLVGYALQDQQDKQLRANIISINSSSFLRGPLVCVCGSDAGENMVKLISFSKAQDIAKELNQRDLKGFKEIEQIDEYIAIIKKLELNKSNFGILINSVTDDIREDGDVSRIAAKVRTEIIIADDLISHTNTSQSFDIVDVLNEYNTSLYEHIRLLTDAINNALKKRLKAINEKANKQEAIIEPKTSFFASNGEINVKP